MSQIVEKVKDFISKRRIERLQTELEKQAGILDYIAMMTDVEIPADSEDNDVV